MGRGTAVGAATGALTGAAAGVNVLVNCFDRGTDVRIKVAAVVGIGVLMYGLGRGTGVSFFAREARPEVACCDGLAPCSPSSSPSTFDHVDFCKQAGDFRTTAIRDCRDSFLSAALDWARGAVSRGSSRSILPERIDSRGDAELEGLLWAAWLLQNSMGSIMS